MNKYLSPARYLRRVGWLANRYVLSWLEWTVAPQAEAPLRCAPIFIVGAPRSGSTLAVQVLTEALNLGYLSNRHCGLFGAPVLAEGYFPPRGPKSASDFLSEHGITKGANAPAECGEWWYRFFRRDPAYVTPGETDRSKMLAFRRSVASLVEASGKPFLFKNLYASLRIQAIARCLPESLFIIMRRNEVDNGHSLLEARFKDSGSYERWFSIEPPGMERLKLLPPAQQVIEQIRCTLATIERDFVLANVPTTRRYYLDYERFCDDPTDIVEEVRAFLANNDEIVARTAARLPVAFEKRSEVRIDEALYRELREYANGK